MATSAAAVPTPPNIAKRLSSNIKHLPRPAKYRLDGQNLLAARPVCQELDRSPSSRASSGPTSLSISSGGFTSCSGPPRSALLRRGEPRSARPQASLRPPSIAPHAHKHPRRAREHRWPTPQASMATVHKPRWPRSTSLDGTVHKPRWHGPQASMAAVHKHRWPRFTSIDDAALGGLPGSVLPDLRSYVGRLRAAVLGESARRLSPLASCRRRDPSSAPWTPLPCGRLSDRAPRRGRSSQHCPRARPRGPG